MKITQYKGRIRRIQMDLSNEADENKIKELDGRRRKLVEEHNMLIKQFNEKDNKEDGNTGRGGIKSEKGERRMSEPMKKGKGEENKEYRNTGRGMIRRGEEGTKMSERMKEMKSELESLIKKVRIFGLDPSEVVNLGYYERKGYTEDDYDNLIFNLGSRWNDSINRMRWVERSKVSGKYNPSKEVEGCKGCQKGLDYHGELCSDHMCLLK